jgi:hypothetical protein
MLERIRKNDARKKQNEENKTKQCKLKTKQQEVRESWKPTDD